jgi:hypothetical protein
MTYPASRFHEKRKKSALNSMDFIRVYQSSIKEVALNQFQEKKMYIFDGVC